MAMVLPYCAYVSGAKVIAIEASPFMIVCGRRQNRDCVNLEFHHQLAENTYIPSNSIDTVTVTLLLHEFLMRQEKYIN